MKVMFVHRSLVRGGAERQLVLIANGLADIGHDVVIVIFYNETSFKEDLDSRVKLELIGKTGRYDLTFFSKFRELIKAENPDVLCSFLPAENLITGAHKLLGTRSPIVWGVRTANPNLGRYGWLTRLAYWIESGMGRLPDLTIANSLSGRRWAIERGFPARKVVVVPNGIDTERFRPRPEMRVQFRRRWDLPDEAILVGIAGRLDPAKDHVTFLRAAVQVAIARKNVYFLCVGDEQPLTREDLIRDADAIGIHDRLLWLGGSNDMPGMYGACDVICLTSIFEGFPNVLAEAMACGVPCISTNVGDAAEILGPTGRIIAVRDAGSLSRAMVELIDSPPESRIRLGVAARDRIESQFATQRSIRAFEQALASTSARVL